MLKNTLCFVFCIGCLCVSFLSAAVQIEDKAALPILSPTFEGRQVLKLRMDNGLQVYLVSDPGADMSSAAMTVKAGSWEDPVEYPGTAHFLEHMLFLGTRKYPLESDYDRFITEHGGLSNAFTANDYTGYVFTIQTPAFEEALDRFASFFIEPLFNPSGVNRELQAIEQEYSKNVEDDGIREYYVLKSLGNPNHPDHAFGMGNRSSLEKVSQDTLKKWYKEHYSANKMRLVVISPLKIETLKKIVEESFGGIPNQALSDYNIDVPIFPDSLKGHMIYIEPITHIHKLSLVWELPPKFSEMLDRKPDQIVGLVLGDEGKNSLLAQLKKEGLAEGIAAGGMKLGGKNFIFSVEINLTVHGLKNLPTVITHFFEAISNFKKKDVPQYLFEELHAIATIGYQYQSREDTFDHIMKQANWIANENLETYPEQTLIIQKFDPKAIKEFIDYLTPENSVFLVNAPESMTGVPLENEELWLKVPYTIKNIPQKTLEEWAQAEPNPYIDLPPINPFMVEKIALVQGVMESRESFLFPHPNLVVNSDKGKIYFAQDHYYGMPEVSWIFKIKTPSVRNEDPESVILGDLYVKMLTEVLSPYTYPASVAGLKFEIYSSDNAITLSVEGYSEKADELFASLLKSIQNFEPDETLFKVSKAALTRNYQNASLENPLLQAFEQLKSVLYKNFVTNKRKAIDIKKINFSKFKEFAAKIFKKSYVEGMLYGNMDERQAKNLSLQILSSLNSLPYPVSEQEKKAILTLPENGGPFLLYAKTKNQGDAVILAIQAVPFSFEMRASQQILMQAMKEPFFSELRTKQQTGYIVFSQADEIEKHLFNIFAVQSTSHDARDLLARFELFIEQYLQEVPSKFDSARFENIKEALLAQITQPPKNIPEMTSLLNKLAFTYDANFDWIAERTKGFKDLTYRRFLENMHEMIGKQNKRRLGILLTGSSPEEDAIHYKKIIGIKEIHKLGNL